MDRSLGWEQNILRSGFTRRAYVAPVQNLHGELRFNYRPLHPEDAESWQMVTGSTIDKEAVKKVRRDIAKMLAEQIDSWGEEIDGKPAPITANNMAMLQPTLQAKVYGIVCGYLACDTDPQWLEEEDLGEKELVPLQEDLGKS